MRHVMQAVSVGLAFSLLCAGLAEARVFTDAFSGQGEACWGNLYIRTKTIEWDTQFSVCQSRYVILKKTFADKPANYDYILYRLSRYSHPTRECGYPLIGLYYYDYCDAPGFENHWSVAGFPTFEAYRQFPYRFVITGKIAPPDDVLVCDLPDYSGDSRTDISH